MKRTLSIIMLTLLAIGIIVVPAYAYTDMGDYVIGSDEMIFYKRPCQISVNKTKVVVGEVIKVTISTTYKPGSYCLWMPSDNLDFYGDMSSDGLSCSFVTTAPGRASITYYAENGKGKNYCAGPVTASLMIYDEDECIHSDLRNVIIKATFSKFDNKEHNVIVTYQDRCVDCDKDIGQEYTAIKKEKHDFTNGVCSGCKHECKITSVEIKPWSSKVFVGEQIGVDVDVDGGSGSYIFKFETNYPKVKEPSASAKRSWNFVPRQAGTWTISVHVVDTVTGQPADKSVNVISQFKHTAPKIQHSIASLSADSTVANVSFSWSGDGESFIYSLKCLDDGTYYAERKNVKSNTSVTHDLPVGKDYRIAVASVVGKNEKWTELAFYIDEPETDNDKLTDKEKDVIHTAVKYLEVLFNRADIPMDFSELEERVTNAPQDIQKVFLKHLLGLKISRGKGDAASFDLNKETIYFGSNNKNPIENVYTFFHEYGHCIDSKSGFVDNFQRNALKQCLENDVKKTMVAIYSSYEKFTNSNYKKYSELNDRSARLGMQELTRFAMKDSNTYRELTGIDMSNQSESIHKKCEELISSKALFNDDFISYYRDVFSGNFFFGGTGYYATGVADLIGGIIKNKKFCSDNSITGHDFNYWTKNNRTELDDLPVKEAMAHFFQVSMSNNDDKSDCLSTYFQTSYLYYKDFILNAMLLDE